MVTAASSSPDAVSSRTALLGWLLLMFETSLEVSNRESLTSLSPRPSFDRLSSQALNSWSF